MKHLFDITDRLPMVFVKGINSLLIDTKGDAYIDCWNDEGVASLGYNSKEMKQAFNEWSKTDIPHRQPRAFQSKMRNDHSEMVCKLTGYDKVFYANSGAEANETAIKLARLYQYKHGNGKLGCVTLEGNFHGRTAFAMACSDSSSSPYHKEGYGPMPKLFGTIRCLMDDNAEYGLRVELIQGSDLPIGDDSALTLDQVGVMNMAPILGNNVVKCYDPEFFQRLRAWCDGNGIILIFDDVQAGEGRCGYFATYQHPKVNIKPDITLLGKGVAAGFPMSLCLTSNEIAKAMTAGTHFNSMAGGDFIIHFSTFFLQWFSRNQSYVQHRGHSIKKRLEMREWIQSVDGYGFMLAFTPDFEGYDGYQLCKEAQRLGLLICTWRSYGPVRFNPPLNITNDELDMAFEILDKAYSNIRLIMAGKLIIDSENCANALLDSCASEDV